MKMPKDLLGSYLFFLLVAYANANDFTWFIGGPDHPNSSANVAECGQTAETPCTNLSVVLAVSEVFDVNGTNCALSTDEGNRTSTTVIFLSGTHVVPTLCLFNWSNVYVQGEDDVSIVPEKIGDYGLFTFYNSSNITIVNLNFVVNISGRAALLFENNTDVTILNCMYSLLEKSSRGIIFKQPQGKVVVKGCTFRGGLSRGVLSPVGSRGLYVICGEGSSNFTIEDCNFKHFYADTAPNQESFYSASGVGQGLVLLFNEVSTRHHVEVSGCLFTDNSVHSGSTLLIIFDSTSQQNSVLISESQFIRNLNLYGTVGIFYWRLPANNSVTIRDSTFISNTAHLEGGGIFAAFLSQHVTNLLIIDNCTFENNKANEGAALVLFNSPTWFNQTAGIRNELVSVNIRGCTFTNNTAVGSSFVNVGTEGIIDALRIKLFFTNSKYV